MASALSAVLRVLAESGPGQTRDKAGQFATGGECPLEGCGTAADRITRIAAGRGVRAGYIDTGGKLRKLPPGAMHTVTSFTQLGWVRYVLSKDELLLHLSPTSTDTAKDFIRQHWSGQRIVVDVETIHRDPWDNTPHMQSGQFDSDKEAIRFLNQKTRKLSEPPSGWELAEFGAVMLELPAEITDWVRSVQAAIPPEYLQKIEEHPHVTVKYGLTTLNDAEIRVMVEGSGKIGLTLGPYSIFRHPGEDVLTVLVASEQLFALRNTIEHGSGWDDGHPWQEDYLAHVTIAYFAPGLADAFDGIECPMLGKVVTIEQAVWSPKGGGPDCTWELGNPGHDELGHFSSGDGGSAKGGARHRDNDAAGRFTTPEGEGGAAPWPASWATNREQHPDNAMTAEYYRGLLADPGAVEKGFRVETPHGPDFVVPLGGARQVGVIEGPIGYETRAQAERVAAYVATRLGTHTEVRSGLGYSVWYGPPAAIARADQLRRSGEAVAAGKMFGYSDKAIAEYAKSAAEHELSREPDGPREKGSGKIQIAVVNRATALVPRETLAPIVAAIQRQVSEHYYPHWGVDAELTLYDASAALPEAAWVLGILEDEAGAADPGWHDVTATGQPVMKVFAADIAAEGESLSNALSHEVLETLGNPHTNRFVQDSKNQKRFWDDERVDPVQADEDGYEIDGILMSNFVLPAYFDPDLAPEGPFDWSGLLKGPVPATTPGGYIAYVEDGKWSEEAGPKAKHGRKQLADRSKA